MDIDKLLKRMRFTREAKIPNLYLLNEICIAFVASIPYETLDMFGGKKRMLDLALIYETIVDKNRGGMCIEMNALLFWLLQGLGFDVKMCCAYNLCDNDDEGDLPTAAVCTHMVLLVNFSGGDKWLTDVGWGGTSFVFPLKLEDVPKEQCQPNGVYMVTKRGGCYIVEKKNQTQLRINGEIASSSQNIETVTCGKYQTSTNWEVLFSFETEPKKLSDFRGACDYAQESHPFCTQNSTAILQDRYHRICLCGDTFIEKQYLNPMTIKAIEIRKCDKETITEILKNKFAITLDFELQPRTQFTWTSL